MAILFKKIKGIEGTLHEMLRVTWKASPIMVNYKITAITRNMFQKSRVSATEIAKRNRNITGFWANKFSVEYVITG